MGYLSASAQASAAQNIAGTNASAWQTINDRNASMQENITQITTDAAKHQTQWQVAAMIFTAQTQYNQAVAQMQYADMADRRQSLNFRHQLDAELRMTTLGYNAQIHSLNLQHQQTMTQLNNTHEEKLAELALGSGQEIDLNTLLT
ncbi:MAG: hypothetical protein HY539_04010 [Deltaproteobacteria bacterium]|nr:hypothetical protein [Deltaproteobacteria bacterium]